MQCRHCGAEIAKKRSDTKYCSPRCRAAYFQQRTNRVHLKDGDTLTLNGKKFWIYSTPK